MRVSVGGFARKSRYGYAVLLDDMSGKWRFIFATGFGYTQTEEKILATMDPEPKLVTLKLFQLGYRSTETSAFFGTHFPIGHELRVENGEIVFDAQLSVLEPST